MINRTGAHKCSTHPPGATELHQRFAGILKTIARYRPLIHRYARCEADREEREAEVIALCWHWFRQLADRGRQPERFSVRLIGYAIRHVRAGRRLCGQDSATEVLSPRAQQDKGFAVSPLPAYSTEGPSHWAEALISRRTSPPDEAAGFRLDFAAFVASQPERVQSLIVLLANGERTMDAARQTGLSNGRVSQIRRKLMEEWTQA